MAFLGGQDSLATVGFLVSQVHLDSLATVGFPVGQVLAASLVHPVGQVPTERKVLQATLESPESQAGLVSADILVPSVLRGPLVIAASLVGQVPLDLVGIQVLTELKGLQVTLVSRVGQVPAELLVIVVLAASLESQATVDSVVGQASRVHPGIQAATERKAHPVTRVL